MNPPFSSKDGAGSPFFFRTQFAQLPTFSANHQDNVAMRQIPRLTAPAAAGTSVWRFNQRGAMRAGLSPEKCAKYGGFCILNVVHACSICRYPWAIFDWRTDSEQTQKQAACAQAKDLTDRYTWLSMDIFACVRMHSESTVLLMFLCSCA